MKCCIVGLSPPRRAPPDLPIFRLADEFLKVMRPDQVNIGRDPMDISFLMSAIIIVGETPAQAKAKVAEYTEYLDLGALLALISGTTGVDLSKYDLDAPYPDTKVDSSAHSLVDANRRGTTTGKVPTIREVVQRSAFGRGPAIVGSPTQVADQVQHWVEKTGVTGFNLIYGVMRGDFEAISDLLVPELQRRGVYKREYRPGTLREKLQNTNRSFLPATHPAARQRGRVHA